MKTLKHLSSVFLLALTIGSSSAQTRYIDDVFTQVTTTSDIVYGRNRTATGTEQNLLLDLYEPTSDVATNRPLIIMCHEGSFLFGSKTDPYMVNYATRMAKKGYVVACMTYRSGWVPNTTPTGTAEDNTRRILPAAWRAIQDYKTAVRFFKKNAAVSGNTYKIDPAKIIGGGFGAGAYLPVNAELLDVSSELALASLQRKADNDPTNNPDTGPYIDTTQVDLGGIYDTRGGSPGFSFKVPLVLIYSGAIIDTLTMDKGTNPKAIAAHGDLDETTPYKTAVVNAQLAPGQLTPIVKVHGTYQITRLLTKKGINDFTNVNSDGFPQKMIADTKFGPLNMYQRGVYTFVNQTYMPWDCAQDDYTTTCQLYMDTVVKYSCPRIAKTLNLVSTGVSVVLGDGIKSMLVYPSPAAGNVTISLRDFKARTFDLAVYDITGKLVKAAHSLPVDNYTLERSDLPAGIYFIKANADGQTLTDKIILE